MDAADKEGAAEPTRDQRLDQLRRDFPVGGKLIEQQGIIPEPGFAVGRVYQLREIGISNPRQDDPDGPGFAAAKILGEGAGSVAMRVDDPLHLFPGRLPDAGKAVNDPGHRRGGNARLPGNIIDGGFLLVHR